MDAEIAREFERLERKTDRSETAMVDGFRKIEDSQKGRRVFETTVKVNFRWIYGIGAVIGSAGLAMAAGVWKVVALLSQHWKW